jgi:hypothetical protein
MRHAIQGDNRNNIRITQDSTSDLPVRKNSPGAAAAVIYNNDRINSTAIVLSQQNPIPATF